MDKLTKDQKDEYATSFAALALYDGGVSFVFDVSTVNIWRSFCVAQVVSCTSFPSSTLTCYLSFLYYFQADISSDQINTLLEATGNTEVAAFYPIIFANFLTAEKISQLIVSPVSGGGGGGGGGGAGGGGDGGEAAEEKKEEAVEEEAPPAVDMVGLYC